MFVKNLSFKYKNSKREILKDISFNLKKDKVNVLVGLNGTGKTTLFDCITNILKPNEGVLNFPSIDQILYLTQTIYFSPELKGKDFVKFISRIDNKVPFKFPESYTIKMDERSRNLFLHLWNTKIGRMSVGEKRWLFITVLSGLKRKLYILDEPTSGVDPSSRIRILKNIDKLVKDGSYCFISTHQLQDLSHIDCNIIMLHLGKVIYEGDYYKWLENNNTHNPDIAFDRSIE
ncbi:ATP-binding cassette domain-containing protein [Robertmurraya andreesenii]|uniref:ABC-2 type transport system ATP-binding protein n=1 Tax=Anoxybacillus andreesenii TaxID=1325932 RepID=A0ABT9V9F4_9BACL|nr:ABC transporter ATP-binding protein [Robertmurraya andreesenii]MDQ0157455.1 ABC-2 type transport system ATP-binding protein [Robertmurraya andreesenii]